MIAPAQNRLFNILLTDDGSLNVRPAIQLMADLPIDSKCLVTALRVFTPFESTEYATVVANAERTKNLLQSCNFQFESEIVLGYPTETIIEYATQHNPDLIVMGAKGAGMFTGLLGSVAANIVHSGVWPVLIVRQPYKSLKKILLVTDGSAHSQATCNFLTNFPIPSDASVEIMYVLPESPAYFAVEPFGMAMIAMPPLEEQELMQKQENDGMNLLNAVQNLLQEHGLQTSTVLTRGDPSSQIIKIASEHQCDLIVCGSHGAGNLTGLLLGSVSRDLVLNAPCSVLVVRKQP